MEVLNALFRCADEWALFTSLWAPAIQFRVSLYVDNLVMFLAPCEQDMCLVHAIMEFFANLSGLRTNVAKCQFVPIQCTDVQVAEVQHWFPCQVINFPFHYHGVPLSTHMLTKDHLHTALPSFRTGSKATAVSPRTGRWRS
jgi:hypothetical protein